ANPRACTRTDGRESAGVAWCCSCDCERARSLRAAYWGLKSRPCWPIVCLRARGGHGSATRGGSEAASEDRGENEDGNRRLGDGESAGAGHRVAVVVFPDRVVGGADRAAGV